jgi:hypothetical protein
LPADDHSQNHNDACCEETEQSGAPKSGLENNGSSLGSSSGNGGGQTAKEGVATGSQFDFKLPVNSTSVPASDHTNTTHNLEGSQWGRALTLTSAGQATSSSTLGGAGPVVDMHASAVSQCKAVGDTAGLSRGP